jgi:Trp operon repressor
MSSKSITDLRKKQMEPIYLTPLERTLLASCERMSILEECLVDPTCMRELQRQFTRHLSVAHITPIEPVTPIEPILPVKDKH